MVLGLVLWFTAWAAWPIGLVLVAVGVVRWAKGRDLDEPPA